MQINGTEMLNCKNFFLNKKYLQNTKKNCEKKIIKENGFVEQLKTEKKNKKDCVFFSVFNFVAYFEKKIDI